MKSTTATLALFAGLLLSTSGCSWMTPQPRHSTPRRVTSDDPKVLLTSAIAAYNDGNTDDARAMLESLLKITDRNKDPEILGEGYFYLAAVAWDLGDKRDARNFLRECKSLHPTYTPDWTFFSPSLRKRFDTVR